MTSNATGTVGFGGGSAVVNPATYDVDGTTLVSGADTDFNTVGATTQSLFLSAGTLGGTGNLTVLGSGFWVGGTMSDAGTTVSQGALSIDGTNAKTINGGRTLNNQGTTTWTGTGNIQHGTGALLTNSGTFDIQTDADMVHNQGGLRLAIANTGMFKKTSGADTTDLGVTFDNEPNSTDGTISVSSGTLFLSPSGTFANYNSTTDTLSGGTYVVNANSTFKFADADIDINQASIALNGLGSAILDASNVDALGDFADNQGQFVIVNDRDLTSTVPVSNSGVLEMGSNSIFTSTGDYTQTAPGVTSLLAASSELVATGGCVDIQGGLLRGNGTAEPCVNVTGGNVQPGLSAGTLNADGTYSQSVGTLDIEIGGTTAGTEHDQLAVTGAATLGGTLALDTISGFTPSDGDSFVVMTYASKTGTFGNETWADLDPSLDFTVVQHHQCDRHGPRRGGTHGLDRGRHGHRG